MRLIYLAFFLGVIIALAMSGCLSGDGDKSTTPITTYLGAYEISFNLTSKYDYDLSRPNQLHDITGSPYWPDQKSETRTIMDKLPNLRKFDVTIIEYHLPQAHTMEALDDELWGGQKGTATWTTYKSDSEFQHTYRVLDKVSLSAACWLDETTMLKIYALEFDREDFINTLKSLRTRKFQS